MNLTEFTAALRGLLREPSATIWSDAVLGQVIVAACAEHSFVYPRVVQQVYDLASAQQVVALFPSGSPFAVLGPALPPPAPAGTTIIRVLGAAVPPGNAIPEDPPTTTQPAQSSRSRTAQGYRWTPTALQLRRPASGPEVGPAKLVVEVSQSWDTPTASSGWNGPATDEGLVLLLAARRAWGLLGVWQLGAQGLAAASLTSGNSNIHIDVPPILAALEVEIKRELDVRAYRSAISPAVQA